MLQKAVTDTEDQAGKSFTRENREFSRQLHFNAGVFCAFKAHYQTTRIAEQLFDADGKPRSFAKFKKAAEPIATRHNKQWLQTEYNTALRSSLMAVNWQQFQKNKRLYPNLEYIRSRSVNPRPEHEKLWGTTRPVDDPFWDTYMPPTGWGCDCSARATREKITKIPGDLPDVPPEFRFNPGKTAEIINTKNHAYYTKLNKNTIQKIREWHKQQYSRQLHTEYAELYENWNENYVLAELMEIPQNLSLQQTLNHIASQLKHADNELLFILNKNGKITGRATGTNNKIKFDIDITDKIVIHNHPSGLPFSFRGIVYNSDIKTYLQNKSYINYIVTDNTRYVIQLSNQINLEQFNEVYYQEYNKILKQVIKLPENIDWDKILLEKTFQKTAKILNFKFTIENHD